MDKTLSKIALSSLYGKQNKHYVKKMRGVQIWIVFCPNGAVYFEHSWNDAMARVQISIAEPSA